MRVTGRWPPAGATLSDQLGGGGEQEEAPSRSSLPSSVLQSPSRPQDPGCLGLGTAFSHATPSSLSPRLPGSGNNSSPVRTPEGAGSRESRPWPTPAVLFRPRGAVRGVFAYQAAPPWQHIRQPTRPLDSGPASGAIRETAPAPPPAPNPGAIDYKHRAQPQGQPGPPATQRFQAADGKGSRARLSAPPTLPVLPEEPGSPG